MKRYFSESHNSRAWKQSPFPTQNNLPHVTNPRDSFDYDSGWPHSWVLQILRNPPFPAHLWRPQNLFLFQPTNPFPGSRYLYRVFCKLFNKAAVAKSCGVHLVRLQILFGHRSYVYSEAFSYEPKMHLNLFLFCFSYRLRYKAMLLFLPERIIKKKARELLKFKVTLNEILMITSGMPLKRRKRMKISASFKYSRAT